MFHYSVVYIKADVLKEDMRYMLFFPGLCYEWRFLVLRDLLTFSTWVTYAGATGRKESHILLKFLFLPIRTLLQI